MKFKDLIGISLISLCLFPVVLLGIMLATGVVRLEFGPPKEMESFIPKDVGPAHNEQQDAAEEKQMKAYKALEIKELELKDKAAEVNREIERLDNLKMETMRDKEEILKQRAKIEEMVAKSGDLQDKQIASLAEVYGGMKPDEAAPILLSLDDELVVKILRKVPETRAASKMLAAISALNVKRAARITELLGNNPTASVSEKKKKT